MAKKGKYADTVNLPTTEFPMRGNLAKREPDFLARWNEMGLQQKIDEHRKIHHVFFSTMGHLMPMAIFTTDTSSIKS